jgi:hypothetical protein
MANRPIDAALVVDWATIWQSEWAAIAVDPEVLEMSQRMAALWASQAQDAAERLAADVAEDRRSRPATPAGTTTVADAPDAGLDDQSDGCAPHDAADPHGP